MKMRANKDKHTDKKVYHILDFIKIFNETHENEAFLTTITKTLMEKGKFF